jgi:hypothetical protein
MFYTPYKGDVIKTEFIDSLDLFSSSCVIGLRSLSNPIQFKRLAPLNCEVRLRSGNFIFIRPFGRKIEKDFIYSLSFKENAFERICLALPMSDWRQRRLQKEEPEPQIVNNYSSESEVLPIAILKTSSEIVDFITTEYMFTPWVYYQTYSTFTPIFDELWTILNPDDSLFGTIRFDSENLFNELYQFRLNPASGGKKLENSGIRIKEFLEQVPLFTDLVFSLRFAMKLFQPTAETYKTAIIIYIKFSLLLSGDAFADEYFLQHDEIELFPIGNRYSIFRIFEQVRIFPEDIKFRPEQIKNSRLKILFEVKTWDNALQILHGGVSIYAI